MKPKDIFGLAVRLLGLVFLYHGLLALPTTLLQAVGGSFWNTIVGILIVGWPLVVAYRLIRGASPLTRIAYAEPPASAKDQTQLGGALPHQADA